MARNFEFALRSGGSQEGVMLLFRARPEALALGITSILTMVRRAFPEAMVAEVLKAFPDALSTSTGRQTTPLHLTAATGSLSYNQLLLRGNPKLAEILDSLSGQLPLHMATANSDERVLLALLGAFPPGAFVLDQKHNSPLRLHVLSVYMFSSPRAFSVSTVQRVIEANPGALVDRVLTTAHGDVLTVTHIAAKYVRRPGHPMCCTICVTWLTLDTSPVHARTHTSIREHKLFF
jgi:hypothetical protein